MERAAKLAGGAVGQLALALQTKKVKKREVLLMAEKFESAAGLLRKVAGVEKE